MTIPKVPDPKESRMAGYVERVTAVLVLIVLFLSELYACASISTMAAGAGKLTPWELMHIVQGF